MSTVDLRDGIESLEYWRARSRRLSWYRFGARREAKLMTRRWEQRVREALLSQRGVPFGSRVAAGLLLARIRLRRIPFRAALLGLAAVAIALMSLPVLLTVLVLTQIF
jgi:predicted nucleic acid-binding protein